MLFLGTLMMFSMEVFPQDSWKIALNKEGIVVYTKNENGSDFKSFKGIVSIKAPKELIIELLKDGDNYKNWYAYTKNSKLLKKEEGVQFTYVETNFPWPFRNRDMVYSMTIDTSDAQKAKVNLTGLRDYIPEKKGIVRMDKAEGYILLEEINDKTKITYEFHSNPGRGIPTRLANRSIAELPFKTLQGLRNIAEK